MPKDVSLTVAVTLPAIIERTTSIVEQLTTALGLPREILASDADISQAWRELPVVLSRIPSHLRDPILARMCVATSVGLLDSAINYAWNAAMIELRNKVRSFGVDIVPQITNKDFDEKILLEMQDSQLLTLCLSLNLITEEGYFMLDQSRDVRNNFSAAHPTIGSVDGLEFLGFLNRCAKFALNNLQNPKGVNFNAFMAAIKGGRFDQMQLTEWVQRLRETHDAQRELLIGNLHGVYCDPQVGEVARLNALDIAFNFVNHLTNKSRLELISRHSGYNAEGKRDRHIASQEFFAKLGLLGLLTEVERHNIVVGACNRLMGVHQGWDNFHNEPPFAERLFELTGQIAVPETAKEEFVNAVATCSVGNAYGTSRSADVYYSEMVKRFSPREVEILFTLLERKTTLRVRVESYHRCRMTLKSLFQLIDEKTVPVKYKSPYQQWINS
jgi:hypothetical protein